MKVLVFGASGATGRLLVDEAVRAGHAVAAFVREPAKLGSHDAVGVFQGDVADPDAVRWAVAGQDAVLCALGAATPLAATRPWSQASPTSRPRCWRRAQLGWSTSRSSECPRDAISSAPSADTLLRPL